MDNATHPPRTPVMDNRDRTTVSATPHPAEKAETKFPKHGLRIPLPSAPICQRLKETNGTQRRRRGTKTKMPVAPVRVERITRPTVKTDRVNPTGTKRATNHIPAPTTILPPRRQHQPKARLPAQAASRSVTLIRLNCSAPTIWASPRTRDTALPTLTKWRTVSVPNRG